MVTCTVCLKGQFFNLPLGVDVIQACHPAALLGQVQVRGVPLHRPLRQRAHRAQAEEGPHGGPLRQLRQVQGRVARRAILTPHLACQYWILLSNFILDLLSIWLNMIPSWPVLLAKFLPHMGIPSEISLPTNKPDIRPNLGEGMRW